MSITRAFTTRRVKQSLELRDAAESMVQRSNTTSKTNSFSSIRNKISAPVELISTTNMLSYNAPDIYPKTASTSTDSTKTDEDEDSTPSIASAASTPPTSPDSPFPAKRSTSPEPNHLSCYFTPPAQALNRPPSTEAPVIPQRAPSHTKKKSYEILTRHRSTSRMSEQSSRSVSTKGSLSFSRSSSTSINTTAASQASGTFGAAKAPPPSAGPAIGSTPLPATPSHRKEPSVSHPFGQELAKVSELAEEFGHQYGPDTLMREEEQELLHKGFRKCSAETYLGEVQGLYNSFFLDEKRARPVWI